MPRSAAAASIVVPTYREQPNLRVLVQRLFAALAEAGIEAEVIIVDDDSQDGTEEAVEELRREYPVRLIVRRSERGLASAVLAGFREAKYDRFVVMDGDLQHPPEQVPALLARLDQGDCDLVIGTRYGKGAGIAADWPLLRRIASRVAALLARPLTATTDPMSGFFALRRSVWERSARLDPIGYKIALELCVKGGCSRPAEVPFSFAARAAGTSKVSIAEQGRYLRHLIKLYRFRYPTFTAVLFFVLLAGVGALILTVVRGVFIGSQ